MEPLNKKERTGFIFKFSAVFIIGILIVLIPFYFTLRLPEYENAIMTKDCMEMKKHLDNERTVFAIQIDSLKRMLNKYDLPNQDIEILNAQLATVLNKMQEPYINDTSWSGRMYKNIVTSFIELKKAKNDKIKSENELKNCKQELDKAKEEAKKSKDTM